MIKLSWVSNPFLPHTQEVYQKVFSSFEENKWPIITETLNDGLLKINLSISTLSPDTLTEVGKISLEPISFAINLSSLNLSDHEWAQDLHGLKSIIKGFFRTKNIGSVRDITFEINGNKIILLIPTLGGIDFIQPSLGDLPPPPKPPIDDKNTYYYGTSKEVAAYRSLLPLHLWIGYTYLTDSPLIHLSLKRLDLEWVLAQECLEVPGHLLIKINDKTREIRENLQDDIVNLQYDGYYAFPSSLGEESILDDNIYWYKELSHRFELEYEEKFPYAFLKNSTRHPIDFFPQWVEDSVQRIKHNNFPRFFLRGPNTWNKEEYLRTFYQGFLAYTRVIEKEPLLKNNLPQVYPNLTISLPVISIKDLRHFTHFYQEYDPDRVNWLIRALTDEEEGKKLLTHFSGRQLHPLLLTYGGQLYLIVDVSSEEVLAQLPSGEISYPLEIINIQPDGSIQRTKWEK